MIVIESDIGLPFFTKYELEDTLHRVAKQICIALYWLKFHEDRSVYFNRDDINDRIKKLMSKAKQDPLKKDRDGESSSNEETESDSDSDDDGRDLNSITDFLLDLYKGLTP